MSGFAVCSGTGVGEGDAVDAVGLGEVAVGEGVGLDVSEGVIAELAPEHPDSAASDISNKAGGKAILPTVLLIDTFPKETGPRKRPEPDSDCSLS
ncbi:MAG: hypothetical protein RL198_417 [Actinomycetota bacterium]